MSETTWPHRSLPRWRALAATLGCLAAGACGHNAGGVPRPATSLHGVPPGVSVYRQQWQRHHLADYAYTYREGAMAGTVRIRVVVRADRVVSAVPLAQPYPPSISPTTIDGLFGATATAYQHADRVTVAYDPTWGFPSEVYVDPSLRVIDDEYAFGVTDFHPGA